MNKLPYVISAELEYADSNAVKAAEIEHFRDDLDRGLTSMGKRTVWLGAEALRRGLEYLTASTDLPIASLDQRYIQNADAYLGVSRTVNPDLSDAGYDARLGFSPLSEQLDSLGRKFGGKEVALIDDVLFSGEMAAKLQSELADRDVRVSALMCGIAVGEGSDKLAARGIEVESVVAFDDVEDELCERDFTVLPGSGRKVAGQQRSALYFDDQFGKPEQWASIPTDMAADFCRASLIRNRQLLRAETPIAAFVGYPAGLTGNVLDTTIAERNNQ